MQWPVVDGLAACSVTMKKVSYSIVRLKYPCKYPNKKANIEPHTTGYTNLSVHFHL